MENDKTVIFKDNFNVSTVEALNLIKGRCTTDGIDADELREWGIWFLECTGSKHSPRMVVCAIELDLLTDTGFNTSFTLFEGETASQSTEPTNVKTWFQATKVVTLEGSFRGGDLKICYDNYTESFAVCLTDSEEKRYIRLLKYDQGCWQVGEILRCDEDPTFGDEMCFRNTEPGLPYTEPGLPYSHLCVVGEYEYIFELHTLGFADFNEVSTDGSATEVDPDVQNTPGFSLAGIEGRIAELEIACSNREEHIAKESKILVREEREMYLLKELLALRES